VTEDAERAVREEEDDSGEAFKRTATGWAIDFQDIDVQAIL
jgi:hypothetical protein